MFESIYLNWWDGIFTNSSSVHGYIPIPLFISLSSEACHSVIRESISAAEDSLPLTSETSTFKLILSVPPSVSSHEANEQLPQEEFDTWLLVSRHIDDGKKIFGDDYIGILVWREGEEDFGGGVTVSVKRRELVYGFNDLTDRVWEQSTYFGMSLTDSNRRPLL
jgi:hypothetical protein